MKRWYGCRTLIDSDHYRHFRVAPERDKTNKDLRRKSCALRSDRITSVREICRVSREMRRILARVRIESNANHRDVIPAGC